MGEARKIPIFHIYDYTIEPRNDEKRVLEKSQVAWLIIDILAEVWYTKYVNDSRANQKITELMRAVLENDLAKEIIVKIKPSNSSK